VPRPDPVVYFDGVIDEVRLYDQTLTADQIAGDMGGEYAETPTPVAAYGFNEGFGTVAGDSAGSNDGTVVGASWTTGGKIGSALDFDGNDEITIPDNGELDLSAAFALEAWVRPASLVGALGSPVISKIDAPESSPSGYLLRAAAVGNRPAGVVAASGTLATASGSGTLPLEKWSHLALTSDGNSLRLYVDGQLVKQVAAVSASSTSAPLSIGASNYSMAKSSTWNIFTQFRHTHEGNLGCTEDPGGVPISFNARYYKAGAHTNPGQIEPATPTSGDYIEVGLNGGEVTADCSDTVKSPEQYVIAKLQHSHWYDFVLHARWTTEEGGPGNSITEVWMDGEQVLGDQSTPISRPTLSWRESPDQRNTGAHRQFGLYRGPSYEDPTSKLYIDAVRSGDSYEQVAPGQ
jgi:Concanavalin A-like lectin/glucanases superfamily